MWATQHLAILCDTTYHKMTQHLVSVDGATQHLARWYNTTPPYFGMGPQLKTDEVDSISGIPPITKESIALSWLMKVRTMWIPRDPEEFKVAFLEETL